MLKQTLAVSIMSLGFIISAPAAAHSTHNDFQVIYPANHYVNHAPVRHCVSGKKINQRQANQRNRINSAKKNGRLVRWEMNQLEKQQRRIRNKEANMRSDRCLTRKEAKQLNSRLDQASRKIHELTSNNVNVRRHHRHDRNDHRGREHRSHR